MKSHFASFAKEEGTRTETLYKSCHGREKNDDDIDECLLASISRYILLGFKERRSSSMIVLCYPLFLCSVFNAVSGDGKEEEE